mmetsp:Transcript_35969/g.56253  ORF Transcript_35969/g.56253 Transcript_35969/m.56253 type:complete len:92 (+) Transcript_35969:702-977(+)
MDDLFLPPRGSIPPPEAKKRKRFSAVWKYFSVQGDQSRCNDCGKLFKSSTATTPLRYHLETSHPTLVRQNQMLLRKLTAPSKLRGLNLVLV